MPIYSDCSKMRGSSERQEGI